MSSKKRITELEHKAGLINTKFFATDYVKEKYPGWKGTDYQAYCLWLEDQLADYEASKDTNQSEIVP